MGSQRARRFLLPFVVSAADREIAFSKDMEMAAVLCLAEMERKKGEGLLKRQSEELVFIAKVGYPIWLVPLKKNCLFFDGLGVLSYTLSRDLVPDVRVFITDIEGSRTKDVYSATLCDLRNYFNGFKGIEEKKIDGLVGNPDLISDLTFYLPLAKPIRTSTPNTFFLSPAIDGSEIFSLKQEILDHQSTLTEEIGSLRETMKLLNAITRNEVKSIRSKSRRIRKEFNKNVSAIKPSVMKKVRKIQQVFDQRISTTSKKFEVQLHNLHRERLKLEKTKQRLAFEIQRCESERRLRKIQKDEDSELMWAKELEKCRKEISPLQKNVKDLDEQIEVVNSSKNLEISKIRAEYNVKADAALKKIRDLEDSRDAKIRLHQQEIETLENLTSEIIPQLDALTELKKAAFDKHMGISVLKKRKKHVLIYLPLYLVCYAPKLKEELKERYVIFPPSVAGSVGILTKFKGAFGVAKIKSLLQPRSTSIMDFLKRLIILIQNNPVFEREIIEAGMNANILQTKGPTEKLKNGLKMLRDEHWISENDFQKISQILAKS